MSVIQTINAALRKVPAWVLYPLSLIIPGWLLYQGIAGNLGPDPVKALEHSFGERGLQVLVAVLAISPLRNLTGINLIKFRRALGLIGFFYIFLHLLVWLFLDVGILSQIIADITKRPYIIIGMLAFVLMIPLAITSNNWMMRKLRRNWQHLHKLTYAVVLLGGVHYLMLVKGWQLEPMIYLAIIATLLVLRVGPLKRIRLIRTR